MSDAVLWSMFVALFSGALFFAWPRSPRWDPVLFHHMVLATLLRGEVEGKDGKLEDWKGLLDAVLPRGPRPPSGGWTEEPTLLGSDYDLAQRLGADASWDGLAEAAPPVDAARTRRLADLTLVWVGPPALEVPGVATRTLDDLDLVSLLGAYPEPHQRFVLATRDHGAALLAALREAPALRDRLRACLFVGATFDPAWLAEHFTQVGFDTEMDRTVPWFQLRTDDRPESRLVEPPIPATGRHSVAVLDLGLMAKDTLAHPAEGRALATLFAALG